jgi:GT2 family glycosyltransferase
MEGCYYCLRNGRGLHSLKILWDVVNNQSKLLVDEFYQKIAKHHPAYPKKIERLLVQTQGLHTLLSEDRRFSYSILVPLDNPNPKYLRETLQSLAQLTAPDLEILVGYRESASIPMFQNEKIKEIVCKDDDPRKIINILAEEARGKYLLYMGQEDNVRCDILFRFEQILRMSKDENLVVYCQETEASRDTLQQLPYVFTEVVQHSLLIPKHLWDKSGGIGQVSKDLEMFDLALKLDLAGAKFCYFPLPLYNSRRTIQVNNYLEGKWLLENYAKNKGLDWTYCSGYTLNSYRAIPALKEIPQVHVIILFKNQIEMTLKTVKTVMNQKGVHTEIIAVDNGSDDRTISFELEKLGVEVLSADEPFNYSRLNNMALKNAKQGQDCDLVLFLNNDVELDEGAVEEMARWIDQPGIGMVGCRLNYPNGLLQHGGIYKDSNVPCQKMGWEHIEKRLEFSQLNVTKVLGIVDGVTAACALMKKSVFKEIGGFDEIWYPICFSDTILAEKLKVYGYLCFYTPYAFGVHHESISRNINNIEDVEFSSWFYQQWMSSQCRQLRGECGVAGNAEGIESGLTA